MITLAVFTISLLLGFTTGVLSTFLYYKIHYMRKAVLNHGYTTREQNKKISANAEYLRTSKNEYAASDFR